MAILTRFSHSLFAAICRIYCVTLAVQLQMPWKRFRIVGSLAYHIYFYALRTRMRPRTKESCDETKPDYIRVSMANEVILDLTERKNILKGRANEQSDRQEVEGFSDWKPSIDAELKEEDKRNLERGEKRQAIERREFRMGNIFQEAQLWRKWSLSERSYLFN